MKNWKLIFGWASLLVGTIYLVLLIANLWPQIEYVFSEYFLNTLKYRKFTDLFSKFLGWVFFPCLPLLLLVQANLLITKWNDKNRRVHVIGLVATLMLVFLMFLY